ncbi:MAG: substrate-binding domain-containing protein, partial [Caldilineaceae bacterium]|nr:substrate-binding domain-containing protein [Caldilineaceae bacterium]
SEPKPPLDLRVSKQPSLRDIAKVSKVSVSTVSMVLNERPGISPKTRDRVRQAATKLGYDWTAQKVNSRAVTVGLVIEQGSMPVLLDIFYGNVIRGFQSEAQRLGYQVLLHMYGREPEGFEAVHSELSGQVRGLVIANDGDITPEMVVQLEATDAPLVLIENHVEGHHLPSVLGDNFTAGYSVMRHLLSLGHREIAILRGPDKYSSLVDRLRGCLSAAAEVDLHIPKQYIPYPKAAHPQKGYFQMKEVLALPQRPTAVVAISDKTAFGAMSAITEAGLGIPEDISVIGIDNVVESAYTHPPLTTFHIPKRDMGILAMRILHRLISGDQEIPVKSVVYGDLLVRESCRCIT